MVLLLYLQAPLSLGLQRLLHLEAQRLTYKSGNGILDRTSPVLSWMVGVGIESFDGYFGTKQLDKTGVQGNIFSTKDLLYDAIGAVLGMITIGIMIL